MSQIMSYTGCLVLASTVRWEWTSLIYPIGIVLFLLVVSVLIPMELSSRDEAQRERAQARFLRAGCIVCLLALVAMTEDLFRGWQQWNILGPRLTRKDYAQPLSQAVEPAAAGWAALAWTLLLVRLHSSRVWRWRPAPVLIEFALAVLVVVVLMQGQGGSNPRTMPTDSLSPGDEFVAEEARIGPGPSLHTLSPAPLIPLAWLFVPLGLATALAALRDWRLARRSALEPELERARRDLARSGLFVLAVSIVWLLGLLVGRLDLLVVYGPLAPPTADLQRDFLAWAWIPGLTALAGLLALCFGAVHLRGREGALERS